VNAATLLAVIQSHMVDIFFGEYWSVIDAEAVGDNVKIRTEAETFLLVPSTLKQDGKGYELLDTNGQTYNLYFYALVQPIQIP